MLENNLIMLITVGYPFAQTRLSELCDWVLPSYETDENHNYCNNEQDMDKAPKGVRGNEAQKPQNNEHCCNGY